MTKVLAINGSYRDDGVTDNVVGLMSAELIAAGAEVEVVLLRDQPIEFCLNCRECTQQEGDAPGVCVHNDGMRELLEKIEASDAYIFASPTNFSSVTAVFKRFMERLIVYGYWPRDKPYPVLRKARLAKGTKRKKAVLVTSCAAPGILGRLSFYTPKQLKLTAKIIGATPVGTLVIGYAGQHGGGEVAERTSAKARTMALKLVGKA